MYAKRVSSFVICKNVDPRTFKSFGLICGDSGMNYDIVLAASYWSISFPREHESMNYRVTNPVYQPAALIHLYSFWSFRSPISITLQAVAVTISFWNCFLLPSDFCRSKHKKRPLAR